MKNLKIYVVISTCGHGDDNYSNVVYVGIDHDKAVNVASEGGIFQSEYNKWNTLECWEDEKKVSSIDYDI